MLGLGIVLIFSSAISIATLGVAGDDAGVASALVNTGQQAGGSVGTALLNTLAATPVANYLLGHGKSTAIMEQARTRLCDCLLVVRRDLRDQRGHLRTDAARRGARV